MYYCQTIFLTFVDGIIQHLSDWFPQLTLHATRGLLLIYQGIWKILQTRVLSTLWNTMSLIYFASTVLSKRFDFGRGSGMLMIINQPPFSQPFSIKTVIQTFNTHRVLCQILLCHVTSVGVERANSSLRYITTAL